MPEPTAATNGKTIEHWPTARAVALTLGCSKGQVYKLEKRGQLRGADDREKGVKLRRYDPSTVQALQADASALEKLLDVELVDEDDEAAGDDAAAPPPNAMRLAAKVVAEARQVATDARKGQQEAFDLVAIPAREYTKVLLDGLKAREERIRELEEKLNKFHDEQRDARMEEREAQFLQSRMARTDERKDQFFKLFTDNLPSVLEQLKTAVGGGAGPFVEWMKQRTPAQQIKMIMAIEAVIGGDEPPAASSPQKATGTDDHPSHS